MTDSNSLESQQRSFKNWLESISLLLGIFVAVFGILAQINNDTVLLRSLGIAGYAVILVVVLWVSWFNKKVHQTVRITSLVVLCILTPLFFTWIGTWIVKAPLDPVDHPIERFAYTIYDYSGANSVEGSGAGYLSVSNSFNFNRTVNKFSLDYTIPKVDSYAGFVIRFDQPEDFSGDQKIGLKIKFKNSQSRVKISLRDATKNASGIVLGEGQFGDASNPQEQVVEIPLENFPNVVRSLIHEIEFSVDGSFANSSNTVVVSNIFFSR